MSFALFRFSLPAFLFLTMAVCLTAIALAAERQIEVLSDRVEYAAEGKEAVFSGNVILIAGGVTVTAEQLRVDSTTAGNLYTATGAPISLSCADCAPDFTLHGEINQTLVYDAAQEHLRMPGGLRLCAGEDCARGKLTAATADWRRDDGVLTLRGAPAVRGHWQPEAAAAAISFSAKQAHYDFNSGELTLQENVEIRRGDSEVLGDEVRFNTRTGALSADSDAGAQTDRRVRATFGGDE